MDHYDCDLILTDGSQRKGVLTVDEENREVYFEEKEVHPQYIVTPSFFNSHTHVGDSHIKDPPPMDLEELVGPGGFKFRHLASENAGEAIASSLDIAFSSGTCALADFREGGLEGLRILKNADERSMCCPLARPSTVEEMEQLAADEYVSGFGLSSVRDHSPEFVEEIRKYARAKNKIFAIHAGERDGEDVEDALNLEPDLIVHMNMATKAQLNQIMDEEIPIVSCIRSNSFFGLLNLDNYQLMADYEHWLIGTDNVMIATPSMLDEMSFAGYLLRRDQEIFRAAFRGFKVFGVKPGLLIFNKKREMAHTLRPISSLIRRAKRESIDKIVTNYSIGIGGGSFSKAVLNFDSC